MNIEGRNINPVAFWERYVDFPPSLRSGEMFSPLVQCPNPGHPTEKRHFQINLQQPKVHCFARCGISGSYEHAVAVIEGLYEKYKVDLSSLDQAYRAHPRERTADERENIRRSVRARRHATKIIFKQAVGKANYNVTKAGRTPRDTGPAKAPDLDYESFLPQVALEYLASRKISSKSISSWGIGWLPDEKRIVIPARDENGHLRLLIKRAVLDSQKPKYLYTEGFPRNSLLFGLDRLDLGMVRSLGLILVEGSFSTIRLAQNGLKISTAILGTGISEQQRRIIARIRPPKVYLFFDPDAAGIRNIEIAAEKLRKYPLHVIRYPTGRLVDPAELTGKEIRRQFERAIPLSKFKALNKAGRKISIG